MPSISVVEDFDVVRDLLSCLAPGVVLAVMDEIRFELTLVV